MRLTILTCISLAFGAVVTPLPAHGSVSPVFEVSLTDDGGIAGDVIFVCCGEGFTPDATVSVEVYDSPGGASRFAGSATTDFEGSFAVGPGTHGLDMAPGMYVVVTDDTTFIAKDMVLADITFEGIDPDTEVATGTAPPGAEVHVGVGDPFHGEFCCISTTADTSGDWSVDFDDVGFDVDPRMGGTVHLTDGDGDTTRAGIPWIPPVFEVSLTDDGGIAGDVIFVCCGEGFTPDSTVSVEVYDSPGGASRFAGSATTDFEGSFAVGPGTHGLDMAPGMYVLVTDDSTGFEKDMVLANISFDSLDPDTDVATGTAPADGQVCVYVAGEANEYGVCEVPVDSAGLWSIDFGDEAVDVTPAMGGTVHFSDDDGDTTRAGLPIPEEEPWTILGFDSPVDMGEVWNTVNGGATVPLKFEVFDGNTELTDPEIVQSFSVFLVECSSDEPTDAIEFVTTGATSLRYDSASGHFIQNWKTPRLRGACLMVTLMTTDGGALVARFQLK
jgi:hypothetical protein